MCKNCGKPVMSDGHGELIHRTTNKYTCHPSAKLGQTGYELVAE